MIAKNIESLVATIIPPKDYKHRNGFSNVRLLESLDAETISRIEDILLDKLSNESDHEVDSLLVETLTYLKSNRVVPILRTILYDCSDERLKIVLAASIFEICRDEQMASVALTAAERIVKKAGPYYVPDLTSSFYYLVKFEDQRLEKFIRDQSCSANPLIAYNAKRALNMRKTGSKESESQHGPEV